MIRGALAAGLSLVLITSLASAEDEVFEEEGTKYVMLSGVYALENLHGEIGPSDRNGLRRVRSASDAGGLQARIGVRATNMFAFEVLYQWVDGFEINDRPPPGLGVTHSRSLSSHLVAFNVKLLPLHGRFQPYVAIGSGPVIVSGSGITTPIALTGRFGGGLDVFINESWSVNADASYMLTTQNLQGFEFATFSLGVAYHFY